MSKTIIPKDEAMRVIVKFERAQSILAKLKQAPRGEYQTRLFDAGKQAAKEIGVYNIRGWMSILSQAHSIARAKTTPSKVYSNRQKQLKLPL